MLHAVAGSGSVGVYVHVPFCERVCPYCDFAVVAARPLEAQQERRMVDALLRELAARRDVYAGLRLESIYLGGGTPSLLQPESVMRILDAVRQAFPGIPREVTLELNPSTVEAERLPGFRQAGVDRLSVGVQSFDDGTLRRLGRAHRAEEARAALEVACQAGFGRLSLDLIFGVAGQDVPGVKRDVEAALAYAPDHVSAYTLTVEAGTPLARGVEKGVIRLPPEEVVAEMMDAVRDGLCAGGLAWYEVSSYARPGCQALHNQRYWRRLPVLGIGVGAHSSEPVSHGASYGVRSANERDLGAWLRRVEGGGAAQPPVVERLTRSQAQLEVVFLGLRTARGLRGAEYAAQFGTSLQEAFGEVLEQLVASRHIEISPQGDVRLTRAGWLLADAVCARFC